MPNVGIPMPNLVPDRISGIQIVSHQLLRVGGGGFYVPIVQVIFVFSWRRTEFFASKLSHALSSHNWLGEGMRVVPVMYYLDLRKPPNKASLPHLLCLQCLEGM